MKKSIIFLLLLAFIFLINSCCSQEVQQPTQPQPPPQQQKEIKDDSLIVNIDTNNIDQHLKNGAGVWLLKFFAPWCKHSQEFQKTFIEMSHLLKDHISFGSIDCINDPMLLHRFEITAYPTLKLLYNGQLYEFQGERTVEQIVKFLQSGYKEVKSMDYPLIDQQEILKRQLELQYNKEGLSVDEIANIERQIKQKQEEYENKKKARKYLEVQHDHNEEQEIAEYNERIIKQHKKQDEAQELREEIEHQQKHEAAAANAYVDNDSVPQGQGNATVISSPSMFDSLLDSKIAYLLFGSISTGLFFIIKKKLSKKSKFMKIA